MDSVFPNRADRERPRRGGIKLTAFLVMLVMALIALNAPVTFAGTGGTATTVRSLAQTEHSIVADVAERANPATVTVLNLQQIGRFGQFGEESSNEIVPVGSGSGYIIDDLGHVVTNAHVVSGGADFQVQLYDGTVVDATLVGADDFQDVAVLKLELEEGESVPGTVSFGDSDTVRAGDTVVAIGSPFGEYTNTVTSGIVNAVDRSLDTGLGYALPNLLQHDADIYPGNSGGPLLNAAGEVIGMNVAKAVNMQASFGATDSNIGFAIESNAVKELVDEIIETGKVARPYLGIRAQSTMQGQAVMSIEDGGPADAADLQAGDVITAIDGLRVDDDHSFINELIFNHQPGDSVTLTILRNGEVMTIDVTLGERPAEIA